MLFFFASACTVYGFLGGLFGLLDVCTLALIALDRYNVVCKPFSVLKSLGHRRAFIQLFVAWIWCGVWSGLPLLGIGQYILEGFQTSCSFDYLSVENKINNIHMLGMFLGCFCFPMLVIFFCYYQIVQAVFAHSKQMGSTAKKMGGKVSKDDAKMKQEIRTAMISLFTVVLFLICWSPYATVALMPLYGFPQYVTPIVAELPVIFAKTAAVYNPIIYAISHPRYKKALRRKLPCLFVCCADDGSGDRTTSRTGGLSRVSSQTSQVSNADSDVVEMPARNTKSHGGGPAKAGAASAVPSRPQQDPPAAVYVVGEEAPSGGVGGKQPAKSSQQHDNPAYEPDDKEVHL